MIYFRTTANRRDVLQVIFQPNDSVSFGYTAAIVWFGLRRLTLYSNSHPLIS